LQPFKRATRINEQGKLNERDNMFLKVHYKVLFSMNAADRALLDSYPGNSCGTYVVYQITNIDDANYFKGLNHE
jgi:hypothetical protein